MAERRDINRLAAESRCSEATVIRWLRGTKVRGATRTALETCCASLGLDRAALHALVAITRQEPSEAKESAR